MSDAKSQVPVLVSLDYDDNGELRAYYSWVDPSNHFISQMEACIIDAPTPFDTLFALDYPTGLKGWTLVSVTPADANPAPAFLIAKNQLSLTVTIEGDISYKFRLNFYNTITKKPFSDDPQEGNSNSPKKKTTTSRPTPAAQP